MVDPSHALVWGDGFSLDAIAGSATAADRARWPDDPTRFGALSRTLWDALLEHETISMVTR